MINLDLQTMLFSATTDLHNAAGAVNHQAVSAGGLHVGDLLLQQLGRDFGEFHRVAATKAAAHFFFLAGHIFSRIANKFARGLFHTQATAQVARGMVGDLLARLVKVFGLEAQHVVHKGAEVDDLGRKGLSFHGREIAVEDFRIVVLEMTGAAGAQGDDVVVVAATEGRNVLLGHVHGGFTLTHHFEGQTAARLFHGEVHGHVLGGQNLHAGFQFFRIYEVLSAAAEDGHTIGGVLHLGSQFGPAVAERLVGNGGQSLEVVLAKENRRQVALELRTTGKGLLGKAGELEQLVEELAVLHHS